MTHVFAFFHKGGNASWVTRIRQRDGGGDIEAQATALHARRNTGTCTPALMSPVLMRVCSPAARARTAHTGDHDLSRQGASQEARLPVGRARGRVWHHVEGRARHLEPAHLDLDNHALLDASGPRRLPAKASLRGMQGGAQGRHDETFSEILNVY